MQLLEELRELGANVDEALERFMGMQALYVKMLGKLPSSVENEDVAASLAAGDYDAAIQHAHTLKGVMGNLSLTPLYEGYTEIVRLLRENAIEEAETAFSRIQPIQEKMLEAIKANA